MNKAIKEFRELYGDDFEEGFRARMETFILKALKDQKEAKVSEVCAYELGIREGKRKLKSIIGKDLNKIDRAEKQMLISWAESEIKEYKMFIKLLKDNIEHQLKN